MAFIRYLLVLSLVTQYDARSNDNAELDNTRTYRSRQVIPGVEPSLLNQRSAAGMSNGAVTLPNSLIGKINQRQPLNLLIVGGSNSAGGGLQHENKIFYNLITNWWNKNVHQTTGSRLTAHKITIGGTGSDFFSFCLQNYLPKEQPDIVLVELSVNDYGYKYGEAAKPMEFLTRRLLLLPSKPLVMYVHFVNRGLYDGTITNTGCFNMEDLGFAKLAQHYGILSISWRDFVCPLTSSGKRQKMNTAPNMFNNDGSHVGYKAHAQIASKIIDHLKKGLASYPAVRRQTVVANPSYGGLVEPVFTDASITDDQLADSMCVSFLAPDWKIPLKHSLIFKVIEAKNFKFVSPAASKKSANHKAFRTDSFGCWASESNTGKLKIRFHIPEASTRSVALVFRTKDSDASTEVWLDDEEQSAITVDSNKCGHHMYQTRLQPIATEVTPGYHILNVASKGGGWFEVSGIIVGYPGYNDYEGFRPFDVKAKMWSLGNFHCTCEPTARDANRPTKGQNINATQYNEKFYKSSIPWLSDVKLLNATPVNHAMSLSLEALLSKARGGRPLHMVVIGGSNSAGAGVDDANQMYYNLITDWWNTNVHQTTGSRLTAHKITIGGTGSDFFSFCLHNYLPEEQPDIVLVELSVNDYGYKYGEAAKPMEFLTRRLLSLPSKPLVMYVHFVNRVLVNGKILNTGCFNMEGLGFAKLAEHYGIPSISWRDFVCPLTSSGKRQEISTEPNMFSDDRSHVGYIAHAQIASKIIDHFKKGLASYSTVGRRTVVEDPSYVGLVEPVFTDASITDDQLADSMCLSFLAPDWKIPLKHSLIFKVIEAKNFQFVSPAASKKSANHKAFRTDSFGCWASESNTGKLKIRFHIPEASTRSVALVYRQQDNSASIDVWLDDEKQSAVTLKGNTCGHYSNNTRLLSIATKVASGYHTVNVASQGGRFEVSGMVIGYPGYHDFDGYRPLDVTSFVWNLLDYWKYRC